MTSLLDTVEEKYRKGNRIHAALIELTHRCPCDCTHCFLVKNTNNELSFDEIADVLRQLRNEGTFSIGFTGGEPFIRKDFPQILELASKDHFFISILTTGILIGQPEVNLLKKLKIKNLEISLLGAFPDTHDSIMNFPGAYHRMMRAVKLLLAAEITVTLKSTIMLMNWKELPLMSETASKLGAQFSASISVAPRSDGDVTLQKLALTEAEIAHLNPDHLTGGLIPGDEQKVGAVLKCRAGATVAGISSNGDIFPCILFRHIVGNIRENTLHHIWHEKPVSFLNELRKVKPEEIKECYTCTIKQYCRRCPGVAYMETMKLRTSSPSACACARGLKEACKSSSAH